eukprot:scaffold96003_cov33-Prasinocladus_malaysianus.AAC.1
MLHRQWPTDGAPTVPLPAVLREMVHSKVAASELSSTDFCSQAFRDSVDTFLEGMVAGYEEARRRCGLELDSVGLLELEELAAQSCMSEPELDMFLEECKTRYQMKRVDPGSTVR